MTAAGARRGIRLGGRLLELRLAALDKPPKLLRGLGVRSPLVEVPRKSCFWSPGLDAIPLPA